MVIRVGAVSVGALLVLAAPVLSARFAQPGLEWISRSDAYAARVVALEETLHPETARLCWVTSV